ncbi:hypothetical protein MN2019_04455 [Mycolicibacterium neoaurum]|uniref:hypothetical protein n=1 Tax=Mycolicibacterium neoaurum TaxID=1795 RepID=UPI001BCA80F4|nr:hypothetical protein [Mycolicibacterium neoaurum]QVI28610.1 hypothetical protein MN2019_04455 [Mycolicibacterium neoaurum]
MRWLRGPARMALARIALMLMGVSVVLAGCSYGPSTRPAKPSDGAVGQPSATEGAGAVSILPGTAALGQPLTAKGATITPRADNLTVVRTAGEEVELGIDVSFTGVTTPIDATGADGGFRLHLSGGEQVTTSRPLESKTVPLAARVRADTDGWVFFLLKPGMRPTQLQLTAAAAGFGMPPAPIAVWAMPATLPPPSAAMSPPSEPPSGAPPAPDESVDGGAPLPPPAPRGPALPPPPQMPPPPRLPPPPALPAPRLPPPPALPAPQLPPLPAGVCGNTPLC